MKELLLLVIGAILGWVGQWLFYRYQRRDEKREAPQVIISRVVQHEHIVFELRNIGRDNLSEMDVALRWSQAGHAEHRTLEKFFPVDQDIRTASATHVELLGSGERYIVAGLPQWSDDGIVNVEVNGFGVQSQRPYAAQSQIVVSLPKSKES